MITDSQAPPHRPGYLYIMRDQFEHNNIKIGLSINPINRVQQLYRTGNALPLVLVKLWWVHDMLFAEKVAHETLVDHRISPRREFFEIAPRRMFWDGEYLDKETTDTCLNSLIDLIEEVFDIYGITHCGVNIPSAHTYHRQHGKTLPWTDPQ